MYNSNLSTIKVAVIYVHTEYLFSRGQHKPTQQVSGLTVTHNSSDDRYLLSTIRYIPYDIDPPIRYLQNESVSIYYSTVLPEFAENISPKIRHDNMTVSDKVWFWAKTKKLSAGPKK